MASRSGLHVEVSAKTWARESHGLFDFEAQTLVNRSFTVTRTSTCWRKGPDEIDAVDERESLPEGADSLIRLVDRRSDGFWVDRPHRSKYLWLVVKELPTAAHDLAEGEIIKLGRIKLRVRQLVASGGQQPELRLEDPPNVMCKALGNDGPIDVSHAMCRICLMEGPGENDPLVAPCKCKGSVEYVHLDCLRYWIRGRLGFSEREGGSYCYRQMFCELCKAVYPLHVYPADGARQPLVELPRTEAPFIVLENVLRDSDQDAVRGLHVLSLKGGKDVKLGRGHDSDVRLADVSISRCHATIRFADGQFKLEDHRSKFGTEVAMKKPRLLEEGVPVSIQSGSTVLTLTAQKPVSSSYSEAGPGSSLVPAAPSASFTDWWPIAQLREFL